MNSQDFLNLQEAYLDLVMNEEKVKYPYGKVANQNNKLERKASSEPDPENQDAMYKKADRHHGIHKRVGGLPYHQLGNPENRLQPDEKLSKKKTPNKFGNRLTRSDGQGIRDSYEYDLYDIILSHLIGEGYADTNENALVIMANMSEEWRESIVEATVLAAKGGVAGAVQVKQTKTPGFLGTGIGSRTVSTPIPGTFTRNTPGRQASGPRSFDAYGSGSKGAESEMSDRSGPTDAERNRYNAAVTKNNTVGDKSVEPSPRAVNQRANQKGHSGLMPTRDNQNSTTYAKPNQSWRGY